jgi:multiple antibiotic resistance protein
MPFYSRVLSLFLVLNAIGNIPLFIGLLKKYDPRRQRQIITRELLIALFILIIFSLFGESILRILGISQPIIGIAGGTLLFLISLGMIFPKALPKDLPPREPMIVPFAIPIIAGPGAITSVMIFSEQVQNNWLMIAIIICAWLPSTLILLAASNIKYLIGEKGVTAVERLGGMLICLFAVQMFTSAVFTLINLKYGI